MVEPSWQYETDRDGVKSTESTESTVTVTREQFQHYDPAAHTIDIRENDTVSLTVTVNYTLTDPEPDKRKPEKTFQELFKSNSVVLEVQYQAITSKGKLESKSARLTVRPVFKS